MKNNHASAGMERGRGFAATPAKRLQKEFRLPRGLGLAVPITAPLMAGLRQHASGRPWATTTDDCGPPGGSHICSCRLLGQINIIAHNMKPRSQGVYSFPSLPKGDQNTGFIWNRQHIRLRSCPRAALTLLLSA